jgi:ATP-dependent DNA helicase DinG
MTLSVSNILSPGGAIANALDGHEPRPQQLAMAEAVTRTLNRGGQLLVEAGTGVGKSFAYLVPAILAVAQRKETRIVIATHTIALQEQLVRRDVPFLQSVMPVEFRPVLVKGRGNYLSLRRLRVARQKLTGLFNDPVQDAQMKSIIDWSKTTIDGTRSDLPMVPSPAVWDHVESDPGNCLGKKCPTHDSCFYFKARKQVHAGNLLIVNHALFFADLAVRKAGGSLLPNYDAVIFDEAHTIEDVAADYLGIQVGQGGIDYQLNQLLTSRMDKGALAPVADQQSRLAIEAARQASERFFFNVHELALAKARGRDTLRIRTAGVVPDVLSAALDNVALNVHRIAKEIEREDDQVELTGKADRMTVLAATLREWLAQQRDGHVYWIETRQGRIPRANLISAPIDVGPALQSELYSKVPAVILTSATLSTGIGEAGFQLIRDRLGLEQPRVSQLDSPFNFREQVELRLFRNLPDPSANAARFEEAVLDRLPAALELSQGRAFVLFTSYAFLKRTVDHLRGWAAQHGYTLFAQGDGLPVPRMIDEFRKTPKAVIFGVDSFWQGVDIRGEALSNVIITKLPFSVPDRPLIEARLEQITADGGNAFAEYSLPQAIIKLKQGFGRLIRTSTDRGHVVIFDPRILTKAYGRQFLSALPECRQVIDET